MNWVLGSSEWLLVLFDNCAVFAAFSYRIRVFVKWAFPF